MRNDVMIASILVYQKTLFLELLPGICGRCGKEVGYTDKCLFEEESFDKY